MAGTERAGEGKGEERREGKGRGKGRGLTPSASNRLGLSKHTFSHQPPGPREWNTRSCVSRSQVSGQLFLVKEGKWECFPGGHKMCYNLPWELMQILFNFS